MFTGIGKGKLLVMAVLSAAIALLAPAAASQSWHPLGPQGGDVRTLIANPHKPSVLYLGTSDGHLFTSNDGGERWQILGRVGGRTDTVIFALLVDARDPETIYAATWTLAPGGGGVFRSTDGGRTWNPAGLETQTVRALAQSRSNPEILIAGTLDGVYRTTNEGRQWQRISPAGHEDLLNFDSVAIDPHDSQIIFAGTYHLAWKTNDAGRTWQPIHKGMIDDSDVMNIEIDRVDAARIYATACSGMYRSENRGELWSKIGGIPPTARRTHFIKQDPRDAGTFYAGTTAGLWKSTDGTRTWQRVTAADWSVAGLVIDPKNPQRLVLGLERRGIYISNDAGATFRASNDGFYHQQVMFFERDPERVERMLVVLTNAAVPVLSSSDAGRTWQPAPGLKPELLRRVYAAPGSWWAAMDRGGLMRFDAAKNTWAKAGVVEQFKTVTKPAPAAKSAAKGKAAAKSPAKPVTTTVRTTRPLIEVVNAMAFTRAAWFAATQNGLLVSRDSGATWSEVPLPHKSAVQSVRVADSGELFALTSESLLRSTDAGKSWTRTALTFSSKGPMRLHLASGSPVVGTANGLFIADDSGAWRHADLPAHRIVDFAAVGQLFVAATESGLYSSADRGHSWSRLMGDEKRSAESHNHFPSVMAAANGQFLAASSTEGLSMVDVTQLVAAAARRNPAPAASLATTRQEQ